MELQKENKKGKYCGCTLRKVPNVNQNGPPTPGSVILAGESSAG